MLSSRPRGYRWRCGCRWRRGCNNSLSKVGASQATRIASLSEWALNLNRTNSHPRDCLMNEWSRFDLSSCCFLPKGVHPRLYRLMYLEKPSISMPPLSLVSLTLPIELSAFKVTMPDWSNPTEVIRDGGELSLLCFCVRFTYLTFCCLKLSILFQSHRRT